jgi:hypothetical protein
MEGVESVWYVRSSALTVLLIIVAVDSADFALAFYTSQIASEHRARRGARRGSGFHSAGNTTARYSFGNF